MKTANGVETAGQADWAVLRNVGERVEFTGFSGACEGVLPNTGKSALGKMNEVEKTTMIRCFLIAVLGLVSSISATQVVVAQSPHGEDQAHQHNRYEFHVVGDVEAPGSHPSLLPQEMLVNLLKIARLFPAESYQLRLVRNSDVEWEAVVPSDQATPSIRLEAGDILIVGSQRRSIGHSKLTANTDDSAEVAIVVPGQKVEFKFITPGITVDQILLASEAGQLEKVVPVAGEIQTRFPGQRVAQDGDVLVFSGPDLTEPVTVVRSTAKGGLTEEQRPVRPLQADKIPIIATGQSTPRQISTANLTTSTDATHNPSPQIGPLIVPAPVIVPADRTSVGGMHVADELVQGMQINANNVSIPHDRPVNPVQNLISADEVVPVHTNRDNAESDHTENEMLQAGIVVTNPSLNVELVAEPLNPFGVEPDATPFNDGTTDPDAIRSASRNAWDNNPNPQTAETPVWELSSSEEMMPSIGLDDSAQQYVTDRPTDPASSASDDATVAPDVVVGDSKETVREVNQLETTTELTEFSSTGLSDTFRSPTKAADDSSEASRRKYSSVLFVLLLLGSMISLIFIWSKKNDDSIEKQLQRFKNYGAAVIPRVSLPQVTKPNTSPSSGSVYAESVPAESVTNVTESVTSPITESAESVDVAATTVQSVAESRLDRLIQNSIPVSQETNRTPRSFELNSEPLGPQRYRVDAAPCHIRAPHIQDPAPADSQPEDHELSHDKSELADSGARIDTPSAASVPRNHFSDVPEGTVDRALNSIEGVSRS